MKAVTNDTRTTARVLVLLSGGLDSAACADFYVARHYHVEVIHLDYGQAAAEMEFRSAKAIAKHYALKLHHRKLTRARPKQVGHIIGRNAFLLFAALLEYPWDKGLLGIGIHAGTPYFDCRNEFITRMQGLFDSYTDGRIQISAPFLTWEKPRIWDYCIQAKVPVKQTYSCEFGSPEPCGKCASCRDLGVFRA